MAMVSIKRYLNLSSVEDKPATALALILGRLGECVVDWDPAETESFREELGTITGGLSPVLPQKEMLVVAEAATQALENYNRRIVQLIDKQHRDFHVLIKMLKDSIVKIAGDNTESVQCLSAIDKELESGTGFKDLQSLRVHLGTCLPGIREELKREQLAARALIERLQIEVESTRKPGETSARRRVDATTGLPGHDECLAGILEAIGKGTRHYAVVMVVNRVEPISARFGKEAGEWMLSRFREYIEKEFEESDPLFRWTGPAIVAILERREAFEQVRTFVKRMLETPINQTLDVNGRSVFIPISCAWSVFMLSAVPEATEKQIQKFIAGQGCRDFV
jgi:GGDEF domain-containing protein